MPAAAAQQIEVRRDAGTYVIRAEAVLRADRRTAWHTVTDYEHLPQFVPGIRRSQVLARSGDDGAERLLVEHEGELRLLWYAQPVRVWLDVRHRAPARVEARSVLPSGVGRERPTLRDFEGSYSLGVVDAAHTRLLYEARFEPMQALLPVLGDYLVRRTITEQFRAMVAEIERRAEARHEQQAAR
jgi:ribosome-associated toxin RatA of RatAB toxin-antitoxin module